MQFLIKLLKKLSQTSKLYAFEVNKKFCEYVDKNIEDNMIPAITRHLKSIEQH